MAISIGSAPLAAAPGPQALATATAEIGQTRVQALMAGAAPTTPMEQSWTSIVRDTLTKLINSYSMTASTQAWTGTAALGGVTTGQVAEDHTFEARVIQLVNAERAQFGLPALGYNGQLDAAAEFHNTNQARTGTMSHDQIGDGDPGSRIRATGFGGSWGENVAVGQTTPEQVVREWMASPGHRANILRPEFRQIGVSYTVGANGRMFWAQEFGA